jgi:hypothetical protein
MLAKFWRSKDLRIHRVDRSQSRARRSCRPGLDSLEDRRLLSSVEPPPPPPPPDMLPDLAGYRMAVAPGSKSTFWGDANALTQVRVQNMGPVASGGFNLRFYLSRDTTYSSDDVPLNLASGGNTLSYPGIAAYSLGPQISTSLVLPPEPPSGWDWEGRFYIVMYTDALNQVAESNEGNNSGQIGLRSDYDSFNMVSVIVT